MTFARKIFLSVFLATFVVGSLLILAAHTYVRNQTKEKFVSRYSVFTKVLADALTRLDSNTELVMLNAAKVIQLNDTKYGVLSREQLEKLRDETGMTHVFIINSSGQFIRSTNEDPSLIPNMFSFWSGYRGLISGNSQVEATPIIKPDPEPKPFKFLSVPSFDRKRIIEVGVRADFIAKTLAEAARSDDNILSMSLYGPDGTQFGRYKSKEVQFPEGRISLPNNLFEVAETNEAFSFFTKVQASQPKCGQCDVSKTSRNGEYFYVIESEVTKKELDQVLATANWMFFGLLIANIILSALLGKILSKNLVQNIGQAVKRVREIKESGKFDSKINLKGNDEVTFLTDEFDRLLDDLEASKTKAIQVERLQAKMQLAREIAHNIKSPIHAIEIMLPMLVSVPERILRVFSDSAKEIKALTEKLKKQAEGEVEDETAWADSAVILVPAFLDDVVERKAVEYSNRKDVEICFDRAAVSTSIFIKADATNLSAILSNLINNAAEASVGLCRVLISCRSVEGFCEIAVHDNGVGIPSDLVDQIGKKRITFKGDNSRGLGLMHAFEQVEAWGGKIIVESAVGRGTSVKMYLPLYKEFSPQPNCYDISV